MPIEDTKKMNVGDAISRFNNALDTLESSLENHLDGNRTVEEAETEVQQINGDRAELVEKLDRSEARGARLENINKEVSRRLVDAMESIRTVIDAKPDGQAGE